jgi:outer membrane murein-binding lipoprotein Lpp
MKERCKAMVFRGFHHYKCSRSSIKDGYCKQHHPDSVKERDKSSLERYEKQKKESCWYKLKEANERIAELESEIEDRHEAEQAALEELAAADDRIKVLEDALMTVREYLMGSSWRHVKSPDEFIKEALEVKNG